MEPVKLTMYMSTWCFMCFAYLQSLYQPAANNLGMVENQLHVWRIIE